MPALMVLMPALLVLMPAALVLMPAALVLMPTLLVLMPAALVLMPACKFEIVASKVSLNFWMIFATWMKNLCVFQISGTFVWHSHGWFSVRYSGALEIGLTI